MKIQHILFGSLSLFAAASSQGEESLADLSARLKKLEGTLSAYEGQYGALNQSSATSGAVSAGGIDSSFLSPASGGGGRWFDKSSIGGYGELHLNQGDKEQIDFHRFVLFVNHSFSDRIKFFSEVELEHALSGDGKPGEVELEQAYIEFLLNDNWSIKAGQYLLPLGILNEVHEPDTFYGVERNNVEKNIIPTTWWEGGVMVSKNFESGLGFDLGVHSGLSVDAGGGKFSVRGGRQKVAEASASDYAASFRARYTGISGLSLTGFANYQNDIAPKSGEDNSALLLGASAVYQNGGFGLRALAAHWDIEGQSFEDNDADSQWGVYVEPSYRWAFGDQAIGVFGRYSHYEYAGGEYDEYTAGVNYWPISNVVLKADFTQKEEDGGENEETYNFGVGYSF